MRWENRQRSQNVDDRRGRASAGGGRSLKLGGVGAILFALVALALGADPAQVLQMLGGGGGEVTSSEASGPPAPRPAEEDRLADFVSVVLADTETTWQDLLADRGGYVEPTLVLFTDSVSSACGHQSAAVGPFYCPGDQQVYLDLGFFAELDTRFGAPGDFAQAYVVAHEVGHHVQHILGTTRDVRRQQESLNPTAANDLSVRLELQADCYAGVWAHFADRSRSMLEPGDLEEGLRAAASVGDDTLQRNAGRRVQPDSFTHGTSDQRVRWFRLGYQTGDMDQCDTFSSRRL